MAELTDPFPYFGGKRRAAPLVWDMLGDPAWYTEPFAGSAAVLLARPQFKGRRVETLNDADGWLVNAWRAIRDDPATVAHHAYGPLTEIDYHARRAWLHERTNDDLVAWLKGDPEHFDAKAAGWWVYVMAAGIGTQMGGGPWRVADGKLAPTAGSGRGIECSIPAVGSPGRGVFRAAPNGDRKAHIDAYLQSLSARLSDVQIICGDWARTVTPSVTGKTQTTSRAVFLDPPYNVKENGLRNDSDRLYGDGRKFGDIAKQVRAWCITASADDPELKIVLCGYVGEHDDLLDHGWAVHQSRATTAGYTKLGGEGMYRERLWASPSCHLAQGVLL